MFYSGLTESIVYQSCYMYIHADTPPSKAIYTSDDFPITTITSFRNFAVKLLQNLNFIAFLLHPHMKMTFPFPHFLHCI